MNENEIAKVAHQVNRAYCESLGDLSQPDWENAPDWQKESAIKGVRLHVENENSTPEDSHKLWLEEKLKDGWEYGPIKDVERKKHPCCVQYSELPQEQRSKDFIFKAVADSLK